MEQTTPARKGYRSDLRDAEWAILEALVPGLALLHLIAAARRRSGRFS